MLSLKISGAYLVSDIFQLPGQFEIFKIHLHIRNSIGGIA